MAKRNNFVQTIKTIAQSLVNNAGYDKTRTGQIVGINEAAMTYSVRVDGQTYNNVKAMDGNQYNLRDIVKVVIPCNQASQIYISSAAYSDNTLGNRVAYAQSVADEAMTFIEEELPEELQGLRDDLEEQIDAKIETWAQDSNPAAEWTTAALKKRHDGDLWLYTGLSDLTVESITIKPYKTYQYNGTSNTWTVYESPSSTLFDLADGKSTIYYGTPSSFSSVADVGDVCINPNDHNKAYRWDGSSWNFAGGGDPINTATITLYQRASSAPSAPSGGQTYTFETGVLNPIPSGWSRDIPSGSNPCYITQTNVTSVNASVTISSWSTPVMFVQDGIDAPTAVVSITVDTISYLNNTATLRATLFVDGAVKTPIIYAWTKGTSTTVVGTNVTLGITDLDAVYNCVVTWSD